MQLDTTFRGLNRSESASATRALEKGCARFERLLEEPAAMRAVIEGGAEVRVTLSLSQRGEDITSLSNGHELGAVVSEACDKVKTQLVRHRERRDSQRHRAAPRELI